ncbi:hypothetical protein CAEBREN_04783 [Caenorhabditis brenneri]|uniref:Uncharacterized protein n=1 Tax=Caenorhabditis brenneri TaxID=135651 RepID=G0NQV8_CAEBE|nr:hypothetical protein CAEBREN_04783 [Caenorhabditis brenneri]
MVFVLNVLETLKLCQFSQYRTSNLAKVTKDVLKIQKRNVPLDRIEKPSQLQFELHWFTIDGAENFVNEVLKRTSGPDTNQLAQINDVSTEATQSSSGCSPATPGAARTTNWRSGSESGWNASTTTFWPSTRPVTCTTSSWSRWNAWTVFQSATSGTPPAFPTTAVHAATTTTRRNGQVNRLGIPNGGPQDFPWNLMGLPPGILQPHQNMLHAPPGLRPPTGILPQFHRRQGM